MPDGVELRHHRAETGAEVRGVVVEDRGGGSCTRRHGHDDQAGDGFVAEVLCDDGEEGGRGATAFRLKEAANFGAVAELRVNGAQHDSHRRGQRGLLDERPVDDLATPALLMVLRALLPVVAAGCAGARAPWLARNKNSGSAKAGRGMRGIIYGGFYAQEFEFVPIIDVDEKAWGRAGVMSCLPTLNGATH